MSEKEATAGTEEVTDAPTTDGAGSQESESGDFEYSRDAEQEEESEDTEQEETEDTAQEESDDTEQEETDDTEQEESDDDTEQEETDDTEQEEELSTNDRFAKLEEQNQKLIDLLENKSEKAEGERAEAAKTDVEILMNTPEEKIPEMMQQALGDRASESNLSPLDVKLFATLISQSVQSVQSKIKPMLDANQSATTQREDNNKLIAETDGDIYNYAPRINQQLWKMHKGNPPEGFNETQEMRRMYQEMKTAEKTNRGKKFAKAKNVKENRKNSAPVKTKTNKADTPKPKSYLEGIMEE